jgi:hypothetical protein
MLSVHRSVLLGTVLFAFAGPAFANDILGRPEYAPLGLTRTVGYHDHARKDGTWSIEANSSAHERSGYASEMALYRAAEVATQQGHPYFQLLRSEGLIGTGMMNRGSESVSLVVRFVDTDARPIDCLQRGRHPGECYTAAVAKVLARLEPRIRDASWKRDLPQFERDTAPVDDHSGIHRVSTLFRFDVTERGTVENCSLAETNAPAELNASACRIFTTAAHFKSSADASGKPIRSNRTMRVTWQQSDLGGPTTMIPLPDETAGHAASPVATAAAPTTNAMLVASTAGSAPSIDKRKPIAPIPARPAAARSSRRTPPPNDTVEVPFETQ